MILDPNILIGILALLLLILAIDTATLRIKIRKMLRKDKNECLCDSISSIEKELTELQSFKKEMETYLVAVEKRLRRSAQAAETVRFNAFRDSGVGGNQSFATAVLNENGDGFVISSLYSRERVSVFSKQIARWNADKELSEEERRAIQSAKAKLVER